MKRFFLLFTLVGCASTAPQRPMPTPLVPIEFYGYDIEGEILRANTATRDMPIKECHIWGCWVLLDSGYVSLKKYLVDLEEDLKACRDQ